MQSSPAPGWPGGSAAKILVRRLGSNGRLSKPRYAQVSWSPSSSRSAQATSMPSTEVPDMQPSTLARREYATILELTTKNSNMAGYLKSRPEEGGGACRAAVRAAYAAHRPADDGHDRAAQ